MTLAPGARVGRYEIVSPLGAGGMGEVYRARDPQLGRDVALKVVGGDAVAAPERLRRFEQEARAVAALRHPHILGVHDVGVHEGRPYLVLELLQGETLRQRLARGPLPLRKTIEVAQQVCAALAAAHARRAPRPEARQLVPRPRGAKVLDFGLAKLRDAADASAEEPTATATDAGTWVGTPGYVSPEQLRRLPASPRSDIFALGAVLYEMVTRRRAFKGSTHAETLSAILHQDPPAMSADGVAVPPAIERVVRRCLEKDPEERFQSARDVAAPRGPSSPGSVPSCGASRGRPRAGRSGSPRARALPRTSSRRTSMAEGVSCTARRWISRSWTSRPTGERSFIGACAANRSRRRSRRPGWSRKCRSAARPLSPCSPRRQDDAGFGRALRRHRDVPAIGRRRAGAPRDDPPRLVLTPTEGGPSRVVADGRLASSLVAAPGHRVAISPDSRLAAAVSADGAVTAVPLDGGDARRLGSLPSGYFVSRWSADGRSLLVARAQAGVSCRLARLDLGSGRLQVLRYVAPRDPAEINDCIDFTASADGSAYAGVHTRCLTDLVLAEGLR
jgi:serine/threonine protein kinase